MLPELSFDKQWIDEISSKFKNMIIVCGSYYDDGFNVCPIVINGVIIQPPYKKHHPSPIENPELSGIGMKPGNLIYIFQTYCGTFSVLTCIDYTDQSSRVIKQKNSSSLDYIINPCCDPNISRFEDRCNSDCRDYGVDVIRVNKAEENGEYGGSCIIAKEHNRYMQKLVEDGLKPSDGSSKYKLFQLHSEQMAIIELNLHTRSPPAEIDLNYKGRIRIRKSDIYVYQGGEWISLPSKRQ